MPITEYLAQDGTILQLDTYYYFRAIKNLIKSKWKVRATGGDLADSFIEGHIINEGLDYYLLHNNSTHSGSRPHRAQELFREYNKTYSWNLGEDSIRVKIIDFMDEENPTPLPEPTTEIEKFEKEVHTIQNTKPSDPRAIFIEIERERKNIIDRLLESIDREVYFIETLLIEKDFDERDMWIRDGEMMRTFGRYGWEMKVKGRDWLNNMRETIKARNYKMMKSAIKEITELMERK